MDTTKDFVIVDQHTRTVVLRVTTIEIARRGADRRDTEYGAVRFRGMSVATAQTLGYVV